MIRMSAALAATFAALALAAAPVAAQTAAPAGAMPKCSATVNDSCDQGADNANAMTAAQAEATGGVGDRGHDDAARGGGATVKPMAHKHKATHHKAAKAAAAGPAAADKP